MAVTKEDCVAASSRDRFVRTSGGKRITVRVSGVCKTWKTRPDEFKLPVKYGLYESGYITHENCGDWTKERDA